MKLVKTHIEGLYVLEPIVFGDERGFFAETYKESLFKEHGLITVWKQDNWSRSNKGVLRGLHFQRTPMAQAKLVRVMRGAVYDVAVDIRPESSTFGQWFGLELNDHNKKALYIPPGFAHGFCTLQDGTDFVYKCSELYSPQHESGLLWNDPYLKIEWPIQEPTLSGKDHLNPTLDILKKQVEARS